MFLHSIFNDVFRVDCLECPAVSHELVPGEDFDLAISWDVFDSVVVDDDDLEEREEMEL